MGYSRCYCHNRLCCDECGTCEGVRKVRCPFGYCKPAALCAACRSPRATAFFERNRDRLGGLSGVGWSSKELHRRMGCEREHLRFEAERQHERDLVAAGRVIRHAAMSTDAVDPATGTRLVQVVFVAAEAGRPGPETWALMRADTYEGLGCGTVATIEDYAARGPVVAGPAGWQGWKTCSVGDVLRAWADARPPGVAAIPAGSSKGVALA